MDIKPSKQELAWISEQLKTIRTMLSNDKNHIIGINLGTSWTVAMTRKMKGRFRSVVGYPKDILAKSVIKEDYLIGEKALENGGALSLVYPFKRGVIDADDSKNFHAASEIFSYAVSGTNPGPDARICCVIGMPPNALSEDKDRVLEIARESCHHAAVVSHPFLVALGMDRLIDSIIVDIGAGTTDICGLKGALPGPQDEITLLTAGESIDAALATAIRDRYPGVSLTKKLICEIKEKHAFVGTAPKPVLVELRKRGIPEKYDITSEIKLACESIFPDIIDGIVSVLSTFDLEKQDTVLQNIYLAGGGSGIAGIETFIEKGLEDYGDVSVHRIKDSDFCGCEGALKISDSAFLDGMKLESLK
ncbi:Magnetosome protein MamK1 [Candidatus Desulfarcum epimagneticum]|uniref:Magnetosome protein MamK1 n=1 Tax=uncultured Desulfobacteraceae bacterium TaxID=218296 RepID=A0A484HFP6_9BACT|nr:Magnetosome protein MamK1 [uncultured Desulfobacteraceae bacterium]